MILVQKLLILLFTISCVLVLVPLRNRKINIFTYRVISILLLFVVFIRPDTMADYGQYQIAFDGDGGLRFEPAFHLVRIIASSIGNVQFWGFLLFVLIGVALKLKYIEKYPAIMWMALTVYLSGKLESMDMVAIRAGAAAVFFLYAIDYKVRDEKKKMFFALFVAVMFHYSALACFVLFLLDSQKLHRRFYLIALVGSHLLAIMGFFLNKYIGILSYISALEAVLNMHQEGETMNFLNLIQIGHIIICVFFWINVKKIQMCHENALLYLKLYTIGICVLPLLAQMISMALRLQELFMITEILLIPMGFSVLFKRKILGRLIIVLYSIIMFYFTLDSEFWEV